MKLLTMPFRIIGAAIAWVMTSLAGLVLIGQMYMRFGEGMKAALLAWALGSIVMGLAGYAVGKVILE